MSSQDSYGNVMASRALFWSRLAVLINPPTFNRSALNIVRRNFFVAKQEFISNFIYPILEPLAYLLAFGYGLGSLIGEIQGYSYLEFFTPGLILFSAGYVSFTEIVARVSVQLDDTRSYKTLLTSPTSVADVIVGEALWSIIKGMLVPTAFFFICALFNLFSVEEYFYCFVFSFVSAWLFTNLGLLHVCFSANRKSLVWGQGLILLPTFLASGILFPVNMLPFIFKLVAYVNPFTHILLSLRIIAFEKFQGIFFIHLAILVVFLYFSTNITYGWSVNLLSRRLKQPVFNSQN